MKASPMLRGKKVSPIDACTILDEARYDIKQCFTYTSLKCDIPDKAGGNY